MRVPISVIYSGDGSSLRLQLLLLFLNEENSNRSGIKARCNNNWPSGVHGGLGSRSVEGDAADVVSELVMPAIILRKTRLRYESAARKSHYFA